ncbi:MAG: hypothetical protein NDJ72_09655, partial [Elusimicrobia bacterium]|nr:hypothetical protein [Elusimicrobiota bacterium]
RAAALDPSPAHAAMLSAAAYRAAGDGAAPDYALLRLALRSALAAAERRPFTAGVLHLNGDILRRLERPGDSREYFARAGTVGFSPIAPKRRRKR